MVEGVKSAVRDAVRGARKEGGRVEVVHTVSVRGGGVKRDVKFAGFEEDYDDSSEDNEENDQENNEDEGIEDDQEDEDEYEESTEEEAPEDIKGKSVKRK